MSEHLRLMIWGGGPVGRCVSQLTIARGWSAVTRTFTPLTREHPWQEGVTWWTEKPSAEELSTELAHIYALVITEHEELEELLAAIPPQVKVVQLVEGERAALQMVADASLHIEAAVEGLSTLDASTLVTGPVPVELVSMALLRAAVEDEVEGELSQADVARLGDALMLQ